MLLPLIIGHLFVLTVANPLHKYPFVFLLDVGNEELKRTNTEQLRISAPGGSVALRYPAVGDGDTIGHVRVSGIDFGTDLKANIVDGGPGYKYVVLVFMGNRGVAYDAVVTVQTVPSEITGDFNSKNIENDKVNKNEESDSNNSAEELDNESDEENGSSSQEYTEKSNAELMQSSSNVYNYAQNEEMNSRYYDDGDERYSDGVKDISNRYSDNYDQDVQMRNYVESDQEQDEMNNSPEPVKYRSDNDDVAYDNKDVNNEQFGTIGDGSDDKYEALRSYIKDGIYSQEANVKSLSSPEYLDYEDSEELDQMFNDEEVHNEAGNYKDSNNNNNNEYVDSDDRSAIAYA